MWPTGRQRRCVDKSDSEDGMVENRVTSVDVARAAGVSQPTVSRAFTPGARVSPELRARGGFIFNLSWQEQG